MKPTFESKIQTGCKQKDGQNTSDQEQPAESWNGFTRSRQDRLQTKNVPTGRGKRVNASGNITTINTHRLLITEHQNAWEKNGQKWK